jgi:hypothetical protein
MVCAAALLAAEKNRRPSQGSRILKVRPHTNVSS